MSKAAQDNVAAKSKALQSTSSSSVAKQMKRQTKKKVNKAKARKSKALRPKKQDNHVLRALNSNKIHVRFHTEGCCAMLIITLAGTYTHKHKYNTTILP